MKRVAALLITLALIAGLVGCPADPVHDPEPDPDPDRPVQYALAISSSEGGEVTVPGEGSFTYDEGTVVSLVVKAEEGYRFVDWTGDVDTIFPRGAWAQETGLATTITMEGDYSITANFDHIPPVQYQLSIISATGGSVTTPGEGTFTYDAATVVDILAQAQVGYRFISWDGDVESIADVGAPSTTVTINGDYSITAHFLEVTEIWDWYDLDAVRYDLGGNYVLMTDLDSTTDGYGELAGPAANDGKGWEPIGSRYYDGREVDEAFTGTLFGQAYEIADLSVIRPDEHMVGLFGLIGWNGQVNDVRLADISVIGDAWVGGLVGWNQGTVRNCSSSGSVSGITEVGGLVGSNTGGTIIDCRTAASVNGIDRVGGVVGMNRSTVRNSHYDYDTVLINGEKLLTIGALPNEDFEEWLANGKFIDVNTRLAQEDGYYVVSSVCDFKQLLVFGQDSSLRFRLKSNLDLSGEPNLYIPYLAGQFDGNGHKILNAQLHSIGEAGVFGYLAPGGRITHLVVENVDIVSSSDYVGGLVGFNRGTVSDSSSAGTVTGEGMVGGLVGENARHGTVTNSYSICDVTGSMDVGGLVGYNQYGTIISSYAAARVNGNTWVGGLVGGNHMGSVDDSHSTSRVDGVLSIGGLVGANDHGGTISNCYSIGRVTGNTQVGGLVGVSFDGVVSDSFWDMQTSGQATSAGGIGKTTADMKSVTTFSGAGWNIGVVPDAGTLNASYVWNIVEGLTYPFLSWQSVS